MGLTTDDLIKIEALLRKQTDELKSELRSEMRSDFATKEEFNDLKDIFVAIKSFLENEHELRFQRLVNLEARVQILEDK